MSVGIRHTKVSIKPDDPLYEVSADEWNDDHVIDEGTARIYSGLDVAKPSGVKGNLFLAMDTLILYRNMGGGGGKRLRRQKVKLDLHNYLKNHISL